MHSVLEEASKKQMLLQRVCEEDERQKKGVQKGEERAKVAWG